MARRAKKQISFTTTRTGANWTIRSLPHGRYCIQFAEPGGEAVVATAQNRVYHGKASAERALRQIADMFIANGNTVQWEDAEK